MHKVLLSVLLSFILVAAGSSVALALQSGGFTTGDLETGSVVGQPFKHLDVDLEYTALMIGGKKACPPITSDQTHPCLLYTSPSPRDRTRSRMPSSA